MPIDPWPFRHQLAVNEKGRVFHQSSPSPALLSPASLPLWIGASGLGEPRPRLGGEPVSAWSCCDVGFTGETAGLRCSFAAASALGSAVFACSARRRDLGPAASGAARDRALDGPVPAGTNGGSASTGPLDAGAAVASEQVQSARPLWPERRGLASAPRRSGLLAPLSVSEPAGRPLKS